MWHLGTWLSDGLGSAGSMVGLDDPEAPVFLIQLPLAHLLEEI